MKSDNDNRPVSRLMTPADASIVTTFSRAALSLLASEGKFPKPVQLGERRHAYVRAEVEAWIDQRIAGRASA